MIHVVVAGNLVMRSVADWLREQGEPVNVHVDVVGFVSHLSEYGGWVRGDRCCVPLDTPEWEYRALCDLALRHGFVLWRTSPDVALSALATQRIGDVIVAPAVAIPVIDPSPKIRVGPCVVALESDPDRFQVLSTALWGARVPFDITQDRVVFERVIDRIARARSSTVGVIVAAEALEALEENERGRMIEWLLGVAGFVAVTTGDPYHPVLDDRRLLVLYWLQILAELPCLIRDA